MTKDILRFLQTKPRSTWTVKVMVVGVGALFVISLGTYYSYTHRKTKQQLERNSSPFQQSSEDLRSLLGLSSGDLGSCKPLGPPDYLPPLDRAYYLFPIESQLSLREEFASTLSVAMTNSKRRCITDLHPDRKKAIGYLLFDLWYPPLETQRHVLYEESLQALLQFVVGEKNKITEARISKKGISIKGDLDGDPFALLFHASKVRESPMTFNLETLRYNEFGLNAFTKELKDSFLIALVRGLASGLLDSSLEKLQDMLERRVESLELEDGFADLGLCRCGVDIRSKGVVRALSAFPLRTDFSLDSSPAFFATPGGIYYIINQRGDWLYIYDELREVQNKGWGRSSDFQKLSKGRWVSLTDLSNIR